MGMDSFDSGGWMNNWGLNGAANPWAQTPQPPAAQPQAPAPAPAAQTGDYGAMFGGLFGDYGGQGAVGTGSTRPEQYNPQPQAQTQAQAPDYNSMFGSMFGDYGGQGAATNTGTGSTRPEVYTGTGYNGGAAAGGAGGASAAGGTPASGPYRTPDWMRNSVLMLDQSPEAQRQFFAANPQYEEDWRRIQAGGNSAFATDGSTLIRSDFNNMSPEAAAYYRENKDALLANEGFGHDPTLAYMNYFGGPASIGANNKTQNISSYLQQNRWTPNGVVGGANNPLMYANTAYGSGTAGYLNGRPGQPTPGAQGAGGTGAAAGGAGGSRPQTGGVYPTPYGSGGGYSGGSSGGGSGSSSSGMGSNPYLQQQADALTGTMTDNWRRNVQPQLASGAQLAGGYGGSRQGVIEANSANDLNQGIGSALANLYSSGYNADRSYDLGLRNNELGWGNLGLGYSNLDRNINNDNLGWQMQGAQFGLSLQDRLMNNNQIGLATGTQINDNAFNNWNRFSNAANSLGNGYGTTTNTTPGNVIGGVLGGAQLGGRIGNWWGSNGGGSNTTDFWAPNFSGSMAD